MNPNEYKFEIGDKVVTIYGEVGRITEICTCLACVRRGFDELTWENEDTGDENYITIWDAVSGFDDYRQIGKYKFNNAFDKAAVLNDAKYHEERLAQLQKQLKHIEEMEENHDR